MLSDSNISDPDAFYEMLISAHAGLSEQQSLELDARLILLLSNQIGDLALLGECIAAARESVLRSRTP